MVMIKVSGDPWNVFAVKGMTRMLRDRAMKHGIDEKTRKPISYNHLEGELGEEASLLILILSAENPQCSKAGIQTVIDVIKGLRGGHSVRPTNIDFSTKTIDFVLSTDGFLADDLDAYPNMWCELLFHPEASVRKSSLKDGLKGNYNLDLKIELVLHFAGDKKFERSSYTVATVIVEYDGDTHLNDSSVRRDKYRDSLIQRNGETVFRIQSPYRAPNVSANDYRKQESDELNQHIDNIREHLRVRLTEYITSLPAASRALQQK